MSVCSDHAVLEPDLSLPQLDGGNDLRQGKYKGALKKDQIGVAKFQSEPSKLYAQGACTPALFPGVSSLGHVHNLQQCSSDQTYSSLVAKARGSSLFPLVSQMKNETLLKAFMLQTPQSRENVILSDDGDALSSKPNELLVSTAVTPVKEKHEPHPVQKRRHVSLSLCKETKRRKLSHIAARSEGGKSDPTTVHSQLPPKSWQKPGLSGLGDANVPPVERTESSSLMHYCGEQESNDQESVGEKQLVSTTKAVSTVLKLISANSKVSKAQKGKLRRVVTKMTAASRDTTAPVQPSTNAHSKVTVADESTATMPFSVGCDQSRKLESQGDASSCGTSPGNCIVQPSQYSQYSVETISFSAKRNARSNILSDLTPVKVAPTMVTLLRKAKEFGIPIVAHKGAYYSNPEDVQQPRYLCAIIE